MKVKIIKGPLTDINIRNCYDILAEKAKKELMNNEDFRKMILEKLQKNN